MYKVFWSDEKDSPHVASYDAIGLALTRTESLRKEGMSYVVMAAQDIHQVGKMGVTEVKDGKLPDGSEYSWKKRRI
jgi:hypothetical protein